MKKPFIFLSLLMVFTHSASAATYLKHESIKGNVTAADQKARSKTKSVKQRSRNNSNRQRPGRAKR